MNTSDLDEHQDYASLQPATPPRAAAPNTAPSQLAVHGDPSVAEHAPASPEAGAAVPRRLVTWVHPSDLPRLVGMRAIGWGIGRGVDLQVALTRTALRAPGRASSALARRAATGRTTRGEAPAGPVPPSPVHGAEGVGMP